MTQSEIRIKKSSRGEYYFNICAPNGYVIASSEMYATEAAIERSIVGLKKYIEQAVVVKQF